MKVVLLAAGRSKRLKPIEDKNFLMFLGKPLIQHQLDQLLYVGLTEVVVVGGEHNLAKLLDLAKGLPKKMKVTVVEQKNLDEGMAGAMMAAEKEVKGDSILVVSGNDVVEKKAFLDILKLSKESKVDGLMLGKKVDEYFPGGYLNVRSNGLITAIVEKPGAGNEPSKLVNLVVHYFKDGAKFIETVKKTKSSRDDRYEVAIDHMIKDGSKIKVVPYDGFWQPIKYPWHVISLMNFFLENIGGKFSKVEAKKRKIEIADTATIRGENVYIGDGARIMDNAVIIGPAYIGKNTIVATNAMVRASSVGDNCVIGFGTEIARSYLGESVWTHTNYVGDSIIGNNCSFGSGTVTGNLRLDEKNIPVNIQGEKIDSGMNKFGLITGNNVRCGINTSFMPGIKIGNNTFVGAGIVVAQDIEDNKFVYAKTELLIKDNVAQLDEKKREEMKKKMGK